MVGNGTSFKERIPKYFGNPNHPACARSSLARPFSPRLHNVPAVNTVSAEIHEKSASALVRAGSDLGQSFLNSAHRPADTIYFFDRNERSTVSCGSSETGWSRHSQRIISGSIAPPMLWLCTPIPHE